MLENIWVVEQTEIRTIAIDSRNRQIVKPQTRLQKDLQILERERGRQQR